ncbi:hypothetical protein [Lamprocystis purpurea]|nr:hypothetical protein [Lamprocystis purpurea]
MAATVIKAAFVTAAEPVQRILTHPLTRPAGLAPARGPTRLG